MENPQPQGERPRAVEGSSPFRWRPKPSSAGKIGVAMAAVSLACTAAVWAYAFGRPVALDSFIAAVAGLAGLMLALGALFVALGYFSLGYRIENQALILSWLWTREIVPLGAIEGIYGGHRLGKKAVIEGLASPGFYVGKAKAEGLGRVQFCGTTRDPSGAIIVATAHRGYAITPADLDGFRDRLIELLEALPAEMVEGAPEPETAMPAVLRLSILRDGATIGLLALALVVLLGSFGYVSARFPDLPELMPLHFNYAGEPDLIGPPHDAFRMPIIGLLILGANGLVATALHQWRRDAGRISAVATVFVQLVMLVAVLRVVH